MGTAAAHLRIQSAASDPVLGEQLANLRGNWKGRPQEGYQCTGL